jgi:Na+-driven multidrug efflux pump
MMGTDGVWLAFPISDVGGGILASFLLRREFRDLDRFMLREEPEGELNQA